MIQSAVFRTLAALAALTSGLGASSTALAHGLQHSRQAHAYEHLAASTDHDTYGHSHESPADQDADGGVPADHAHAKLDAGTIRISVDIGPVVTTQPIVWSDPEAKPAPTPVAADRIAPTELTTGPPPHTRAPPIH